MYSYNEGFREDGIQMLNSVRQQSNTKRILDNTVHERELNE